MTNEQSERPKGRVTFIASAAVVALIVILGIVVGIVLAVRNSGGSAPKAAATTTAPATAGPDTAKGSCGRDVSAEASNSLTSAPATTWKAQGPSQVAYSKTGGGFEDQDGYWSCYSRTAEGALYATYNVAQYCTDTTLAARALPETVADGPGKAAAAAAAKQISSPCTSPDVQGYRIQSYDGTNAVVFLLINTPSGQQSAPGFKLVWEHDDWKIAVDSSGNNPIGPATVDSSDGYTPWGPTDG